MSRTKAKGKGTGKQIAGKVKQGAVHVTNHRAFRSGKVHEAMAQADVEKAVGRTKDTVTKAAAR